MTTAAAAHAVPRVRRTRRRVPWLDRIAYGTVVALLVLAVVGPLIAPHDPYSVDLGQALQSPSGDHLLGTDGLGRDVLSRALAGARASIQIGRAHV